MNWEELTTNLDYRHYILVFISIGLFLFLLYLLFRNFTFPNSNGVSTISEKENNYIYSDPLFSKKPKKRELEPPSIEPGDKIIPQKKPSKGQKECKRIMEKLFKIEFPTVRPKWLINPKTGKRLELDCYSFKHRIACEYNGRQHRDPNSFGQGEEKLREQKERDRVKLDLCDQKGIYVITVPDTTPIDQIEDFIIYYLPQNRKARLDAGMTE